LKLPKRIAGLGALRGAVTVIALSAVGGALLSASDHRITARRTRYKPRLWSAPPASTKATPRPHRHGRRQQHAPRRDAGRSRRVQPRPDVTVLCDGLTLQSEQPGQSTQVIPNADGSVTFKIYLWELPTGQHSRHLRHQTTTPVASTRVYGELLGRRQ